MSAAINNYTLLLEGVGGVGGVANLPSKSESVQVGESPNGENTASRLFLASLVLRSVQCTLIMAPTQHNTANGSIDRKVETGSVHLENNSPPPERRIVHNALQGSPK